MAGQTSRYVAERLAVEVVLPLLEDRWNDSVPCYYLDCGCLVTFDGDCYLDLYVWTSSKRRCEHDGDGHRMVMLMTELPDVPTEELPGMLGRIRSHLDRYLRHGMIPEEEAAAALARFDELSTATPDHQL